MTTTWMWKDENTGGVQGAVLDPERAVIQWYDQPGCACGDNSVEQDFADFLANGANGGNPPSDIAAEIHDALADIKSA